MKRIRQKVLRLLSCRALRRNGSEKMRTRMKRRMMTKMSKGKKWPLLQNKKTR